MSERAVCLRLTADGAAVPPTCREGQAFNSMSGKFPIGGFLELPLLTLQPAGARRLGRPRLSSRTYRTSSCAGGDANAHAACLRPVLCQERLSRMAGAVPRAPPCQRTGLRSSRPNLTHGDSCACRSNGPEVVKPDISFLSREEPIARRIAPTLTLNSVGRGAGPNYKPLRYSRPIARTNLQSSLVALLVSPR